MVVKRIPQSAPDGASYRIKRRLDMPPVHEQLDALWSGLAVMQMHGVKIPEGTVLKTKDGDIILTESIRLDFDLPKPMDNMIGRINGVRIQHPKEDEIKHIDEVTGKEYKTAGALKGAITRRKKAKTKKKKK